MKKPRVGDFISTHNDCGIVKWVGLMSLELDNNVNTYSVPFDDVTEVIR